VSDLDCYEPGSPKQPGYLDRILDEGDD